MPRRSEFRVIHGRVPHCLYTIADNTCAGFITDPPYCSGGNLAAMKKAPTHQKYISGKDAPHISFSGDSMSERVYIRFTTEWLHEITRICGGSGTGFIFTDWRMAGALEEAVGMAGLNLYDMLVWDKSHGRIKPGGWMGAHEFIAQVRFGGYQAPREGAFYGKSNILQYTRPPITKRVHFAQKPPLLLMELMKAIDRPGPIIDPFAGSGTTAIAAVQSDRDAILIEAEAKYVALATDYLTPIANANEELGVMRKG